MKTELTVEQSRRLIELGAPREKASAFGYIESGESIGGAELPPVEAPVFTLDDLLEMLPKWIEDETWGFIYEIAMRYDRKYECWGAVYSGEAHFTAPGLIDALYLLACWYYGEYLKSEER